MCDAGKKVTRKAAATPEGFLQMMAFPTILTMFIAGIWHGAGFQFVIFGTLQGLYLTVNHAWRIWTPKGTPLHQKIPNGFMVVLTFLCFLVSLVFFRARDTHDALFVLGTMIGLHGHGIGYAAFPFLREIPTISKFLLTARGTLLALTTCFFIVWALPNTQEILGQTDKDHVWMPGLLKNLRWRPTAVWSLGLTGLFCLAILLLDASKSFLYFQF